MCLGMLHSVEEREHLIGVKVQGKKDPDSDICSWLVMVAPQTRLLFVLSLNSILVFSAELCLY